MGSPMDVMLMADAASGCDRDASLLLEISTKDDNNNNVIVNNKRSMLFGRHEVEGWW
jgi:hypothetical protein